MCRKMFMHINKKKLFLSKYEIYKNKYQSPLPYEQILENYHFKVVSSVLSADY